MARPGMKKTSPGQVATSALSKRDADQAETARNADILLDLIVKEIAPDTWTSAGGKGTISYVPKDMTLVVNQTQDVQEQIQDLICGLNRQFKKIRFDAKLVEAKRGGNKVKSLPRLTFFDEQTASLSLSETTAYT